MVSSGAGCEVSGAAGAVGAGSVGAGAVSCFGAFFSVVSALVGAAAFVGFAIELLSCAPFVLEAVVSEVVVPEVVVPEAEEVLRWNHSTMAKIGFGVVQSTFDFLSVFVIQLYKYPSGCLWWPLLLYFLFPELK